MMYNEFGYGDGYFDKIDNRKVVKYKCRACKREWIENNNRPQKCPNCDSKQFHELNVKK